MSNTLIPHAGYQPPSQERILVIDDIREYEGCVHAKTAREGIELLKQGPWDEVWLDHDLGGDATIRPVVEWLQNNRIAVDCIWVITANPAGQKYIIDSLRDDYRMFKKFGGTGMGRKMLKTV